MILHNCNIESRFEASCRVTPLWSWSDTRELTIATPEFPIRDTIVASNDTSHAELAFLVVAIHPETGAESHAVMFRSEFALDSTIVPAQQWTTANLPENHLIVVASAVFFYRQNNLAGKIGLNQAAYHPCIVVAILS